MSPSPRPYVLHVDDDESLREVLGLVLEQVAGYEVRSVDSGPAALAAVRQRPPDLVVLDVMMPGMDGPETLRRLQELPEMLDVPVVFLTAKVLAADIGALQGLGAAAILQKPFRSRELIAALERVLDRS